MEGLGHGLDGPRGEWLQTWQTEHSRSETVATLLWRSLVTQLRSGSVGGGLLAGRESHGMDW